MAAEEFVARAVSFDTETHLVQDGLLAPPLVCGSEAEFGIDPTFLDADWARRDFDLFLEPGPILVGANIAYDMVVMIADAYRKGVRHGDRLIERVFAKYDGDEVFDVQIAQALNAIAGGHLFKDPVSGAPMKGRYSLDTCVKQVLGRDDAKVNDFWRMRYGILERVPEEHWPAEAIQYPKDDARNTLEVAVAQAARHRNLHCMPDQARAAFALQLASAWGFRTDKVAIDKLEADALAKRAEGVERWRMAGFLNEDGSKEGHEVKRRLARAYGAARPCPSCGGTGRILNAKGKDEVFCTDKNLAGRGGAGCDGTGLDIADAPMMARTPTGGIKAGRDELHESGDEGLMQFAGYQEDDKLLNVYVPFLRKGQNVPLNPRANVLVASARTSYDEVMQQMPREGGVRDCFVPRPGYVFCSTDYSSGELCTFAQVLLWVVGRSKMAEIINESKDPGALHTHFGAKMAGRHPDEFKALVKEGDKTAKAFRQAAKAFNFGLGGGMGEAKFVISKRKKNEGKTPAPDGRTYNGLRFCILVGGAERCGVEMVTEWKGRPTSPICKRCVEVVRDLKAEWLAFFDEVPDYFKIVSANVDATGEMVTCPCGMVRGGLSFTDGSNHNFQHLLACGAKRSLWYISREMYTDRNSPLYHSRVNAFFHDEVFSEMPEDLAPLAGPRQAELMIQGLKEFVPDVHVACEPALMRRWTKAAEPVFVDGKLTVWEPKEKR